VVGVWSPQHSVWEAVGLETGWTANPTWSGLRPGIRGYPGAVARSDVDAVPGDGGQGGGPVMGHDGSHSRVDGARLAPTSVRTYVHLTSWPWGLGKRTTRPTPGRLLHR
jgi:hypothetical protein